MTDNDPTEKELLEDIAGYLHKIHTLVWWGFLLWILGVGAVVVVVN